MDVKSFFPTTRDCTYLNTAACGLISKSVFKIKNEDNRFLFQQTPRYLNTEDSIVSETKSLISKIYNAAYSSIAITPNFSISFNHILDGIDSNLSFLCLENDYPSLIYPIKKRGFDLKTIPATHQIEEDIYAYIRSERPHIFALSITQFINGLHISPAFLKALKKDFPELLIIADATQYLGVEHLDFNNSGIDLLIASCYKWLNAGFGSSIVLMSEHLKPKVQSKTIGANSLIDKTKMKMRDMGFLEPGHFELNSIKSLQTALKLHYDKIGIDFISKKIKDLSGYAFERFEDLGLLDTTISKRNVHSSIFNLSINPSVLDRFEREKIHASQRGTGVRVSLHYYNTREDIEHFINVLVTTNI